MRLRLSETHIYTFGKEKKHQWEQNDHGRVDLRPGGSGGLRQESSFGSNRKHQPGWWTSPHQTGTRLRPRPLQADRRREHTGLSRERVRGEEEPGGERKAEEHRLVPGSQSGKMLLRTAAGVQPNRVWSGSACAEVVRKRSSGSASAITSPRQHVAHEQQEVRPQAGQRVRQNHLLRSRSRKTNKTKAERRETGEAELKGAAPGKGDF